MPALPNILSDHDLELLSAYLDDELTGREKVDLEQRLVREEALRLTLDELRDTVRLVRSLPRLSAPRNFTLDPARYGRKTLWQRWFSAERGLQWVGALGAAASILLITFGLLWGGDNQAADRTENLSPADEDSGYEAASALSPQPSAGSLTPDETAIAYSGDDTFQATLAMQSAYYGGTETAEAVTLSTTTEMAQAPGAVTAPNMKDESETSAAPPAAAAVPQAEEAVPAFDSSAASEAAGAGLSPSPTGSANGQSPGAFNTTESAAGDAAFGPEGVAESGAEIPAEQQVFGLDAAAESDQEAAAGMVQPVPAPPTQPDPGSADGAMREYPENEASITPIVGEVMNAPTVATGPQTGQRDTTSASPPASMEYRTTTTPRRQESNNWWMVGAGLITLFASIGIFLIGRRRA